MNRRILVVDDEEIQANIIANILEKEKYIVRKAYSAEEAIKRVATELPSILVGAGTVLNVENARRAIAAGAKFIVSPGFSADVVKFCIQHGMPITPGCSNPTDIGMAVAMGLEVVKFFPAEAMGGIKTLKAIAAPYGMVKFIPTGGIDASNLNEYLSFNKVHACGGSWMVKADLIKAGNFAEIGRLTQEAMGVMLGFDMAHIGINAADAESSLSITNLLVKGGMEITAAKVGEELAVKIREIADRVETTERTLVAYCDNEKDGEKVIQLILSSGASLVSALPMRRTLEHLFVETLKEEAK
jgi:Entner-Doudoroff aldolase